MNMRKITSLLCAIFVFMTLFTTGPGLLVSYGASADSRYVYSTYGSEEHWAEKYLENLVNQDIMRGDVDGNLRADDKITRAEFVTKLTAVCVKCGAPATRTQRLVNGQPAHYNDSIVLVGASESYEPRCRHCHEVIDHPLFKTIKKGV